MLVAAGHRLNTPAFPLLIPPSVAPPTSPHFQASFDAAYAGNRAPLPIFIHTPWMTAARIADLQRFAGKSVRCKLHRPEW